MYGISVPVGDYNDSFNRESVLINLKKMKAKRVFLSIGTLSFNEKKRQERLTSLKELIAFFKKNGLEVGVWLWAFMRADITDEDKNMCKIKGFDGSTGDSFCPSSPAFVADTCDFMKKLAALEPDIIMFDDDFRYGYLSTGFGCCCENHLKMMSERLGEAVAGDGLAEKIFCGGENRFRDAWLDSLAEAMKNFALSVRKAVDSVNPDIRIAACSCMSLWDLDGIDSASVARLLAGKTKPLLRLIGAPYWAVNYGHFGQRLQNCIELERMQSSWCSRAEIELMAEGDTYPRPRHNCPSAYLEGFDTALRCAGATDGILKYAFSYVSSPEYEPAYSLAHIQNEPLYAKIEKMFSGKKDAGIRVFESMNKIRNAAFPQNSYVGWDYIQKLFYSPAAKMMSDNTVPVNYSCESSVGVCFGENAAYLNDAALNNGLFIDLPAAKILMNRGVDVGIERIGENISRAPLLKFKDSSDYIESSYAADSAAEIVPKAGAVTLTNSGVKGREYIDTIFYENGKGQKFVVFSFDAYRVSDRRFRSYEMQKLIYRYAGILGKPLLAKCPGHPDLYMLCREQNGELAIGLWNFFADAVQEPVVDLEEEYALAKFVNCSGTLDGKKVRLSKLSAYEFAFILLKKNP